MGRCEVQKGEGDAELKLTVDKHYAGNTRGLLCSRVDERYGRDIREIIM